MAASGLCHSDDHHATGDMRVGKLPFAGGHEGAGVVEAVGPHTPGFAEGDHVVFSFLPSCGRCRWCATGHQNLCDLGASIATNTRWDDPTSFRLSLDGEPVGQMCGLSTFCEHTTVSVASAVRVDPAIPLEVVPDRLRLYQQGALKLDELITTRYALDDIARGFADMHAGRNLRGVVVF